MILWIDAQISPRIAPWIKQNLDIEAVPLRELGLRDADDMAIFVAAKNAEAAIITKDEDFAILVEKLSAPPQIIWLTCGNTSNSRLKEILASAFGDVINLLESGEPLVEISGR
jgi:predicted nuclease of predicted toxin-antitoxin system